MHPYISVIIPAFNECYRIENCIDVLTFYMDCQDYSWELLICNDGSTDNTGEIVQQMAFKNPSIRLMDLPHQGKGSAVRHGMLQSKGELRVLCDADFSMPVEQISRLIHESAANDIVIASRELSDSRRFNEPVRRHVMGRVFNIFTRIIVLPKIKDSQCGFKLFTKQSALKLFEELHVEGFAFDVEVLVKARKLGFSVKEVPIDWYYFEGSKVRIIKDTMYMFRDLLRIALKYR